MRRRFSFWLLSNALGVALLVAVGHPVSAFSQSPLQYANAYEDSGYWMAAALARISADRNLNGIGERAENQHRIWSLLQRLPPHELESLPSNSPDEAIGWWDLARRHRRYADDRWLLDQSLDDWSRRYPRHPAHDSVLLTLRSDLPGTRFMSPQQTMNQRVLGPAREVILLLPLSGEHSAAGLAIRKGFVERWRDSGIQLDVREIDTSASNPLSAWQTAQRRSPDLIVGPLDKSAVSALARRSGLSVATLALNYADHSSAWTPGGLFQFGLAPEHEAMAAADLAARSGLIRAAILASEDSWGQRTAQAFADRLASQGGQIIANGWYRSEASDLEADLKSLMQTETDWPLWRDARGELRPSNQIDVIFIAARERDARLLMPLLRFHHAVDLPVFSTGAIHNGKADRERDHDLLGSRFCGALSVASKPDLPGGRAGSDEAALPRLTAMGHDSFLLSQQLGALQSNPDGVLAGETGRLSLAGRSRVLRLPQCHQIRLGGLTLIKH